MIIAKYISPFLHNRIVIAQIFHRNKKDKFTLQKKQIHINAGASFYQSFGHLLCICHHHHHHFHFLHYVKVSTNLVANVTKTNFA